ncbi:hypothetical protein VE04_09617, partial [Pseudogymnoascus sp. 24MN13]
MNTATPRIASAIARASRSAAAKQSPSQLRPLGSRIEQHPHTYINPAVAPLQHRSSTPRQLKNRTSSRDILSRPIKSTKQNLQLRG